jgi:hypothetical protein
MDHSEPAEPDPETKHFGNVGSGSVSTVYIKDGSATLNAGASVCREQGEADQLRHRQPYLQGGRSGRHKRA